MNIFLFIILFSACVIFLGSVIDDLRHYILYDEINYPWFIAFNVCGAIYLISLLVKL